MLITSLPFVHTARRFYRLNYPMSCKENFVIAAMQLQRSNYNKSYNLEEGEVVTR